MLVLDASVVIKWFVQEKGEEAAETIKTAFISGEEELLVPGLLLLEIANVLRYKPGYTKKSVQQAIHTLMDMELQVINHSHQLMDAAIDIAYDAHTTVYDSLYVALSLLHDAPLVTADRKLATAVGHLIEARVIA